jgi:peptidoglycan/xylan/chitin deacetylase (PgdA/CDA1 family)
VRRPSGPTRDPHPWNQLLAGSTLRLGGMVSSDFNLKNRQRFAPGLGGARPARLQCTPHLETARSGGSCRLGVKVAMHLIFKDNSPVLLYHAVFRDIPKDIRDNLHNVHPEILHEHLSYLKKHYRIVPVDELTNRTRIQGTASITFDDGYKCVIDEVYEMLLDLDIPYTIFVNSGSMKNEIFWRDKVRYIINNDLVDECEAFLQHTKRIAGLSFYRYTKHYQNNSRKVDQDLDQFLQHKGISFNTNQYCFDNLNYFKSHRLISYGNHTHNHYLLASLSREEQYDQIQRTQHFLRTVPNVQVSEAFSLPFGGPTDFNEDTLRILQDLGYRAMLLSRQRLNFERRTKHGLAMVERVMPKGDSLPLLLARLQFA